MNPINLEISGQVIDTVNNFLSKEDNTLVNAITEVIDKYGGVQQINQKAKDARNLDNIFSRLKEIKSPYLSDLEWLIEQRDHKKFIQIDEYRKSVLGSKFENIKFKEENAVTLEISALQYFPWLIKEAKRAIDRKELMPGRYIRVRKMKEQEANNGELMAVCAAMQIIGASHVETLDTKGTDGSNVHLGGPATITGYFGGVGQPNHYAIKWADELLYYYTNYGIREVLNVNFGTILIGFLLYKLGIDISFKISVYTGHDNPYNILWTMMMAKLFSRDDGTTPLAGINLSNSANVETVRLASYIRKELGFEKYIRIEHHITEAYKSIVIQPYNRRDDLLQLAKDVPNISAKHEGGEVEVEQSRAHPSDILDYFRDLSEITSSNEMDLLEQNYMDKHEAVNNTARALTEIGIGIIPAVRLHGED